MPDLCVNGARLHYEDSGHGPSETVVFAHGLLWSGDMFRDQVAALAGRHRCITFDFRGQGESEITRGGYDMDSLTDDAIALVDALGAAPCHWVGLSMGGFVGLRVALRRPELLRSLALVASAGDGEPRRNIPKYLAMGMVARHLGLELLADRVMRIMFARPLLDDPARAARRDEMRRHLTLVDRSGAVSALGGVIARDSLEDRLGDVRVPTLVLSGELDAAIAPERARRTADRIPGARFVPVPRAGHTASVEEPEAVTRALESFWASLG